MVFYRFDPADGTCYFVSEPSLMPLITSHHPITHSHTPKSLGAFFSAFLLFLHFFFPFNLHPSPHRTHYFQEEQIGVPKKV